MNNFPYLILLLAVPLAGATVLAALGRSPARTLKFIALGFSLVEFALAVGLWLAYRSSNSAVTAFDGLPTPTATPPSTVRPLFSQTFSVDWIPSFDIHFSLGVDGISLVMIALIAFLVPIVLGASWEEKLPAGRTIGGYFSLILVMQSAMTGVFAATDVFLFYVMFEVMLIPMYFLIGAFGGLRGTYAATKFFLYSLLGGLLMLASIIGLYVASGRTPGRAGLGGTLDWAALRKIAAEIPLSTQLWIFAGFAIAFAIKAPLVPFHTWLPDAGAEAPVGAGTLLVGVLDKVGTFGFLRICLPLLPAASSKLAALIITLAVVGIIYGAIVAAGQTDLKRFVTYTSISHFGFIAMGVFAFTTQAISGAVLYMVNHGVATALLFLVVGMLTARGGSRLVGDYGGVWKVAPLLGGFLMIGALAAIALPGTNSFVSEFLVLIGTFTRHPVWAIIATVGIILAALYMLWIFQRTMTGPIRGAAVLEPDPGSGDPEDVHDAHRELGGADPLSGFGPEPVLAGRAPMRAPVGGAQRRAGHDRATALGHEVLGHEVLGHEVLGHEVLGHAALGLEGQVADAPTHGAAPTGQRFRFGDLNRREIAVLTPLVVVVLFLGVYPKPVLDVINPTAARTVSDAGYTDPPPRVPSQGAAATNGAHR